MRGKLTQRTVEQARQQARKAAKAIYFWDTDLKGFGCYVSAKGDVSWIVQRWIGGRGGKSIRHTIERASLMPLDAARKQAEIELGEVRKGVDLAQRKRDETQAINAEINGATLAEAFDRYLKRKGKPGFYWLTVEQTFKGQLIPELGEKTLVSKITKHDIRKLIEAKEDIGLSVVRLFGTPERVS